MAACTSASVASMTGSRLVFWFAPATSAFNVRGYVSGTVCCFSTSTPITRVSSSESAGSGVIALQAHAAEQPDHADRDEVDGHDVVEQSRHHEDQDAGDEGDDGADGDVHVHEVPPWIH